MNEPNDNTCPTCGKPMPPDAPMGICPNCLLGVTGETAAGEATNQPAPNFEPPTPEELGKKFPQLEILEFIGRGGMGAVYKARQKELDRVVAVKILPPGIGDDPAFADRFAREAKALAKLNHPNIVTLYEFGSADGLYYFMMEFIDGVNLRQAMSAGRFTPEEALAIVPPVCEALQYAHERGVVHRDIKPENLLLDKDGKVKIADFGVAKMVGASAPEPVAAANPSATLAAGTPRYMAPEQKENPTHADHRVDIYAMGVVLYELLTGETPKDDLLPPSKRVQMDVRIDEIVLRALAKEPELRFATAMDLQTQVETMVSSHSSAPSPSERTSSGQAGKSASAAAATVVTQGLGPHKTGMVRLIEIFFDTTFTSPLAIRLVNGSHLGFLGFLGALGFAPFEGWQHLFGLSGFFGFFGLIGVAFMVEWMVGECPGPAGPGGPSTTRLRQFNWKGWAGLCLAGLSGLLGLYFLRDQSIPAVWPAVAVVSCALLGIFFGLAGSRNSAVSRGAVLVGGLNVILAVAMMVLTSTGVLEDWGRDRAIAEHKPAFEHARKMMLANPDEEKWFEDYVLHRDALVKAGYMQERVFNVAVPIHSPDYRILIAEIREKAGDEPACSWSPGDFSTQVSVWARPAEMREWEKLLSKWKWLDSHPLRVTPVADAGGGGGGGGVEEILLTGESAKFGPVVQRVVHDLDDRSGNDALSLRTGEIHALPDFFDGGGEARQRDEWLDRHKVDLLFDFAKNRWAMFGRGTKFGDMGKPWSETSPFDVVEALEAGSKTLKTMKDGDGEEFFLLPEMDPSPPLNFAVRLRNGQIGLLQISEMFQQPRSVLVRFKAVNSTVATGAGTDAGGGRVGVSTDTHVTETEEFATTLELMAWDVDARTGKEALSLRAGQVHDFPESFHGKSEDEQEEWLNRHEVDLVFGTSGNRWGMFPRGVQFGDVSKLWSEVTPADLEKALTKGSEKLEGAREGDKELLLLPADFHPRNPLNLAVRFGEGRTGLLQIAGFGKEPKAVLMRFKAVTSSGGGAESGSVTFSEPSQCTLTAASEAGSAAFNLEDGRYISVPEHVRNGDAKARVEWLAQSGADILAEYENGEWFLRIHNLDSRHDPTPDAWNTTSAEEFARIYLRPEILEKTGNLRYRLGLGPVNRKTVSLLQTWFFWSKQASGILEITAVSIPPRSLRLRYKLIEGMPGTGDDKSPRTTSATDGETASEFDLVDPSKMTYILSTPGDGLYLRAGSDADGQAFVWAADALSGEVQWSRPLGEGVVYVPPVTDGEHVIVGSPDGHVYYGRPESGGLIWKEKLNDSHVSQLIPAGEVVLAVAGNKPFALDLATGEKRWTSNPILDVPIGLSDGKAYFLTQAEIRVVDVRTGTPEWSQRTIFVAGAKPVDMLVAGDHIFIKAVTKTTDLDNPRRVDLYALRRIDGKLLWRFEGEPEPVYSMTPDPHLKTGIAVAQGRVVFNTFGGMVYVLRIDSGEETWHKNLHVPAISPPVTAPNTNSVVFRTAEDSLLRLDLFLESELDLQNTISPIVIDAKLDDLLENKSSEPLSVVVNVDADEAATPAVDTSIVIEVEPATFRFQSEELTLDALEKKIDALPTSSKIVIRADKSIEFSRLVEVLNLLKKHGMADTSIVRKPEDF